MLLELELELGLELEMKLKLALVVVMLVVKLVVMLLLSLAAILAVTVAARMPPARTRPAKARAGGRNDGYSLTVIPPTVIQATATTALRHEMQELDGPTLSRLELGAAEYVATPPTTPGCAPRPNERLARWGCVASACSLATTGAPAVAVKLILVLELVLELAYMATAATVAAIVATMGSPINGASSPAQHLCGMTAMCTAPHCSQQT